MAINPTVSKLARNDLRFGMVAVKRHTTMWMFCVATLLAMCRFGSDFRTYTEMYHRLRMAVAATLVCVSY